jgi:cobalamin-dependent methionine synthase I
MGSGGFGWHSGDFKQECGMSERDQMKLLQAGFMFVRLRKNSNGKVRKYAVEVKSIANDWDEVLVSEARKNVETGAKVILENDNAICVFRNLWI